eukprot:113898-Prymnesium_polylepis.3
MLARRGDMQCAWPCLHPLFLAHIAAEDDHTARVQHVEKACKNEVYNSMTRLHTQSARVRNRGLGRNGGGLQASLFKNVRIATCR